MPSKMSVLIIGAGAIGQAIGKVVDANANVGFWDQDQSKIKGEHDFTAAVQKAEVIFICTPSWTNRGIARNIAEAIVGRRTSDVGRRSTNGKQPTSNDKLILSLSKGIEEKTSKLMEDVLKKELGHHADYGVIAGPMMATELKKGEPTAAVIGLSNTRWQNPLRFLFSDTNLNVSFSTDLKGLSLCSALKNIYATGLGMAEGLGEKINFKSVLTDMAIREMLAIVPKLGGQKETVVGLAGLGDLLATGWSDKSHNFTLGQKLVSRKLPSARKPKTENRKPSPRSEGTVSLKGISHLLGANIKNYPLLSMIKIIIAGEKSPRELLKIVAG